MDTLCGLGLPELVLITLIGFVLIGPERSRELALQLGRWLRRAMQSSWWRDFNQVTDALRNLPTTLVRMAELEEVQQDIQRELRDIEQQARVSFTPDAPGPQAAPGPGDQADPWNIGRGGAAPEPDAEAEPPPESPPDAAPRPDEAGEADA